MATTPIEWTATYNADGTVTKGRVWNPVTGCHKVSPGCKNCYAAGMAKRLWAHQYPPTFGGASIHKYPATHGEQLIAEGLTRPRKFEDVWMHPDRLMQPFSWKKPCKVFVNSMSDLFEEAVPFEFIDKVFAVMALNPHITFQVLTKRAERMREYFKDNAPLQTERAIGETSKLASACKLGVWTWPGWPLPNVWIGVSAENQKYADERIPHLLQTPAAIRFVSAEPLLGPIDFGMSTATCKCCKRWSSRWVKVHREVRPQFPCNLMEGADKVVARPGIHRAESNQHGALSVNGMGLVPADFTALPKLDLIIFGGESGGSARPCEVEWIADGIRQCRAAGVAAFNKQLGTFPTVRNGSTYHDPRLWAAHVGFNCDRRAPKDWREPWPYRPTLKNKKGGDPSEWPSDLRIREFPKVAR